MLNLDLNTVRNRLEAVEETIIFRILDRAQFKLNLAQNISFKSAVLPTNPKLKNINLTAKIKENYEKFLNIICEDGNDDEDEIEILTEINISALNAISRRIHYGSLYVAKCKFEENPKGFRDAVIADDKEKIIEMLRNIKGEEEILLRISDKCAKIQSIYSSPIRRVISPNLVREFYKHTIIPLTIEGELQYFFERVKNETK
jgi:chorismate mutase